jgi:hypothetical protein
MIGLIQHKLNNGREIYKKMREISNQDIALIYIYQRGMLYPVFFSGE